MTLTDYYTGNVELFKELKKHLNKNNSGQDVPDTLEGKVTHSDILEKFKECYSDLYNSADTSAQMEVIKENIMNIISNDQNIARYESLRINSAVVKEACRMMKSGKSDVTGSYTSDVFLNAPDILYEHLAMIFKSYLIHGTVTKEILFCSFLPLF